MRRQRMMAPLFSTYGPIAQVCWPSTHDESPDALVAAWSPSWKMAERCLRLAQIWQCLWSRRMSVRVH